MIKLKPYIIITLLVLTAANLLSFAVKTPADDDMVTYTAEPSKVKLYWKDYEGNIIRSLGNLQKWLSNKKQTLVFAMNGGMYMEDNAALGLFIQDGKTVRKLNKASGYGNFYMKPNGVFYTTNDGKAVVCNTTDFKDDGKIKYATQSGPMLVINGQIHPSFKQGSSNTNIRNGVGILPNGKILFAMSKNMVNLYDFAAYFKEKGCKNALFLDGFVSRTYLPEQNWKQTDGNFGVIIGVTAE